MPHRLYLGLLLIGGPMTAAGLTGCEGNMVRDAGGGQDDSSTPGRPADDGGVEAGAGDAATDGGDPADGACDGGDGGDGATGCGDGGGDGGDGG